jgi:hypothetical protein
VPGPAGGTPASTTQMEAATMTTVVISAAALLTINPGPLCALWMMQGRTEE